MRRRRRFGRRERDMPGRRETKIGRREREEAEIHNQRHRRMPIGETRAGEGGRVIPVVWIGSGRRIGGRHGEGGLGVNRRNSYVPSRYAEEERDWVVSADSTSRKVLLLFCCCPTRGYAATLGCGAL